jgi:hypothetical protein
VQSALQAAFPACNDLSDDPQRGITSFTPHLSLGQWRNKQQVQEALQVSTDTGVQAAKVPRAAKVPCVHYVVYAGKQNKAELKAELLLRDHCPAKLEAFIKTYQPGVPEH